MFDKKEAPQSHGLASACSHAHTLMHCLSKFTALAKPGVTSQRGAVRSDTKSGVLGNIISARTSLGRDKKSEMEECGGQCVSQCTSAQLDKEVIHML